MSSARFLATEFGGGFFPAGGGGTPAYADFPTNDMTPPALADLTVISNSVTETITSDSMGIVVFKPGTAAGLATPLTAIGQTGLTAPFVGTAVLQRLYTYLPTTRSGVFVRDATGRYLLAEVLRFNSTDSVFITRWASASAFTSVQLITQLTSSRPSWWRIVENTTNHTVQVSVDGFYWNTVHIEDLSYVATATSFGFSVFNEGAPSSTPVTIARCIHFEVTS